VNGESSEIESRRSSSGADVPALMVDESLSARARLQMREALSSIASRVDFAESGGLALKLIDRYAYSVIFLDAMLPDEDAYEICGRIKKHPLQQRASTVMLTCNASPAERVMGMLAGFDNFLAKPIRREGISELAVELARPAAAI
jgi:DNA-binding response OmpR family regulator